MPASAKPRALRVLLADAHALVREGVRHVLESLRGVEGVGEADNGTRTVELAVSLTPDVVVLDLSMPGLTGLEVMKQLRERASAARVLVLSIHEDEEYVLQSVRAGALGYLRKDSSPAELREAVRTVGDGGSYFSAPVARALSDALQQERAGEERDTRISRLTARERDVLVEIAGGATNKDIAARLGISVRTVESHRETMMRKLELRGIASLTRFALDAGLIRTSTEK
jgi:DNA-binding NarL/FixJ family response regulator